MTYINVAPHLLEPLKEIAETEGFSSGYVIEQVIGSNHGDGFIGTLERYIVTGMRTGEQQQKYEQLSVICKQLPDNPLRCDYFSSVALFQREAYMYSTVIPKLIQFQREKGLTEENGFFGYPKCYLATDQLIIMSDLRTGGYEMWDRLQEIPFENVRLLMVALGRLHALSFAMRDQQPKEFDKFKRLTEDSMLKMAEKKAMQGIFESSFDLALQTLDADSDLAVMKLIREQWLQMWDECLSANVAEPFSVIGHGDCWNNNMMFRASDNNSLKDICLLDWQMSRLGSPVLDLCYFFMTSTHKPLRDKHFDELLHIYHDSVCDTVSACGSDPSKLFTFSDLQEQFRKFGKYGLTMAPVLIEIMVSEAKNIVEMDVFAADIEKNGTKDKFFVQFDDRSRRAFITRMSGVIRDAVKYGWIKM